MLWDVQIERVEEAFSSRWRELGMRPHRHILALSPSLPLHKPQLHLKVPKSSRKVMFCLRHHNGSALSRLSHTSNFPKVQSPRRPTRAKLQTITTFASQLQHVRQRHHSPTKHCLACSPPCRDSDDTHIAVERLAPRTTSLSRLDSLATSGITGRPLRSRQQPSLRC